MTIPHFPPMTDEQSIRFMLTLPWAMGDNAEDGSVSYDAGEIETVLRFVDSLNARAEAAEATLASCNRARQAAEAENDRLRKQVAQAKVDGANEERSLHWMRENTEIAALRKQVATLRYALQFVMSATGNRLSITSMNVATSALEATYNTSQDAA